MAERAPREQLLPRCCSNAGLCSLEKNTHSAFWQHPCSWGYQRASRGGLGKMRATSGDGIGSKLHWSFGGMHESWSQFSFFLLDPVGNDTPKDKYREQWMRLRINMNMSQLIGQILVCDPFSIQAEGALGGTVCLRSPPMSSPRVTQLWPTLTNFVHSLFGFFPHRGSRETQFSSSFWSRQTQYAKAYKLFQSFGSAGDGDLRGIIAWTTAYGCVIIYRICFWSIPAHTGHPEACITSHSCWIHLETLHQMVQTSWILNSFSPFLSFCSDGLTHHPTWVWHLLIASDVDAREHGGLLLVKLSDLLSKQSRKCYIACSAVRVSTPSLHLHGETTISIH